MHPWRLLTRSLATALSMACGTRRHRFVLLGLTALLAAPAAEAQGCVRHADGARRDPYLGLEPTGYKGSSEADRTWARDVRMLRTAAGDTAFVFRAPRGPVQQVYESIESFEIGPRRRVYLAWKDGCADVTNALGATLMATPVSGMRGANRGVITNPSSDSVLVTVDGEDSIGVGSRLVLIVRGRVAAESRHLDRQSYSATLHQSALPAGLLRIATRNEFGMGAIDARTLRDVLPPRFRGVGGLLWYDSRATYVDGYLLADDSSGMHLFRRDGSLLNIARFDTLRLLPHYLPGARTVRTEPVIETEDRMARTCRAYRWNGDAIVPDTMRLRETGYCPRPRADRDTLPVYWLSFDDVQGRVQSYQLTQTGASSVARDVLGHLEYGFGNGAMVVARGSGEERRYHVLRADGQAIPGAIFDGFQHLGCGFTEVRRGARWLTLVDTGETSEKRYYPFSC